MWRRQIEEGEDPLPHLGRIRSAHAHIMAAGENPDRILAYAMTLALPPSFATIQQNLWLRSPLSSAEVAGAVQAEWARRKISDSSSGALVSKQAFGRPRRDFAATKKDKLFGPDQNAYCTEHKAYGHDTSKCHRLHGRLLRPSANVATTIYENSIDNVSSANFAKYNHEGDSDGSAFVLSRGRMSWCVLLTLNTVVKLLLYLP